MNEILLVSNPRGRRKSKRARRFHRNPSFSLGGIFGRIVPTLKDGAIGAVGGVANDALFGFGAKFLPETLRTGLPRHGIKVASAVVIGAVGNMVLRGRGNALAVGAATCALHEALKEYLAVTFPTLPLGEYDQPLLGWDSALPVGEYMGAGQPVGDMGAMDAPVGEYMP